MEDNMKNEDLDERHDEDVEEVETVKEPKISDVWKASVAYLVHLQMKKKNLMNPVKKNQQKGYIFKK